MVNTREVIFNEATAQWYLYIAFFLCSCDKALDCLIRMVQWKHWRTTFSQGTETVLDWKLNIARHCFTNVFQIWTVNSHPAFLLAMWACWQCPLVAMYKYFIWLLAFCHLYYVYIYARMWKKKLLPSELGILRGLQNLFPIVLLWYFVQKTQTSWQWDFEVHEDLPQCGLCSEPRQQTSEPGPIQAQWE